MLQKFDAEAGRRIGEAVRALESRSAAELVVEIRGRSGSYAHADARFAALLALISLGVLVYMPLTVPPIAVLLDPIAFYVAGVVIARRSVVIRRAFTSQRERLSAVRTHAAALFHDRGIANTSGETGVLLYASLLERRLEVLADRGLLQKVVANDWNAALAELHEKRELDVDAVIATIERLAPILGRDLPASDVNEDELSNAPEVGIA
jgi:putative membrane protein